MSLTISPSLTAADREKSGGAAKHETINNACAASALSGLASAGSVPEHVGRASAVTKPRDGGNSLPAQARAYHAKIAALRKQPGNCGRCGKPNTNGHKRCDRCRAYEKQYKTAKRLQGVDVTPLTVAQLVRRVQTLEMAVARLELWREYKGHLVRKVTRKSAAIQQERRKAAARLDAMPRITEQELATMNHAYDNEAAA